MHTPDAWQGVFTALVTPFADGHVDLDTFETLVARQIAAGISGLVPVGTTGEAATLSDDEATLIIARCVAAAGGAIPVVAGAGSNDSARAAAKARAAEIAGANALLVVTPYYNKPTQAGLLRHYDIVAGATGLPIMLYSVPGRCGIEIEPETCARLRERHRNIVAIKEAGGSPRRVTRIRALCGTDFAIHSGDDAMTLPFLALGAVGVTSVVSNYAPEAMVAMVRAMQRGDGALARDWHDRLADITDTMFIEANPGPVKAALAHAGLAGAEMRAPLAELSPASLSQLVAALEQAGRAGIGHRPSV